MAVSTKNGWPKQPVSAGVKGIQPEQEGNNDKIEFGLTEIVSFLFTDLACAHNVIVRK
jgi:hypothetical protein